MDKPIILPNHFNENDTIIYNRWILNGCKFFHVEDAHSVLEKYEVPEKVWQQVLNARPNGVTESDSLARFAYIYCRDVSNDPDIRQIIINSGDAMRAYSYCRDVSNDADMRQVIIDSGNGEAARWYCIEVSNDSDIRQVIIDSGNSTAAVCYCHEVSNDADMRVIAEK